MITNYTICRVNKNLYLVKAGDDIVKECDSYTDAQNYIFTAQTEELLNGYEQAA